VDHSKGVKSVVHTDKGDYLVSVDVASVNKCTNVASIVSNGSAKDGGTTITVSPTTVTNTIQVQTWKVDTGQPVPTDHAFSLAVFCQ
jgi:hypothetical protein